MDTNEKEEKGTEFIKALYDAYNSLKYEDKKEINVIAANMYLEYVENKEKDTGKGADSNENNKNKLSKGLDTDKNGENNNAQQGEVLNKADKAEEYKSEMIRAKSMLGDSLKSLAKIAGLK